jgi:alkylhydroperoxidase family enzyme
MLVAMEDDMPDHITRLTFEQLAPAVQQVLDARVKRLGYLGEFFRCAGHQPDILVPFMEMTEALKRALPDRLTEVGALTVATMMANDYERHQHERLSRKLGFGEAWVAAVERLEPHAETDLNEAERAVQRLVIAILDRRGRGVAAELDAVIDLIGTGQAIAVLFLIGRYLTHAVIVNALELAPPVPSIFEGVSA